MPHTTSYNKAHVQRVLQYDIVECICCYITQHDCYTTEHAALEQHMHSTTLYYRTCCTWPLLYAYINTLQHTATCCNTLQHTALRKHTSHIQRIRPIKRLKVSRGQQCVAVCCCTLLCVATCCIFVAACCSVLQCVAVCCSVLQ